MNALALTSQLQTYKSNPLSRDQILRAYSSLVRLIARRIAARFPANLDVDDLVSNGYMGLMDAMDKFDGTRDISFKTYAEYRIRGAMLDGIREQDWIPRSIRAQAKAYARVFWNLEQKLGREADSAELCGALGLELPDFHRLRGKVLGTAVVPIIDLEAHGRSMESCMLDPEPTEIGPQSEMESLSLRRLLQKQIDELPEIQQRILISYYFEDLTLKEIGRILSLSESRVCQLHKRAIGKLRAHLDKRLKRRDKKEKRSLLGK